MRLSKLIVLLMIFFITSCASIHKDFQGKKITQVKSIAILVDRRDYKSFGMVQGGNFEVGLSILGGGLTKGLAIESLEEKAKSFEDFVSLLIDSKPSYKEKFYKDLAARLVESGYDVILVPMPNSMASESIERRRYGALDIKADAALDLDYRGGYLHLKTDIRPQTELSAKLVSIKSGEILYRDKFYCCAAKESSGPGGTSLAAKLYRFKTLEEFSNSKNQAKEAMDEFNRVISKRVAESLSVE